MKKGFSRLTALLLPLLFLSSINVFADTNFSVQLQQKLQNAVVLHIGKPKAFVNNSEAVVDSTNKDVYPFIKDGRTLVPVRFISENLGAEVEWDDSTKAVTVKLNNKTVQLTIGSKNIYINGVEKEIDVPAQIMNERTFIPLRALVEALDKKVFWDDRGLIVISDNENILNKVTDKGMINELITKISEVKNIIVSINGQEVSVEEFRIIFNAFKLSMEQQGITDMNTLIEGKKAVELAKDRALQALVQYKLESQNSRQKSIALSDEEVKRINDEVNTVSTNNPIIQGELNNNEYTLEDLRSVYIELNIANKFRNTTFIDLMSKINPTDKEVLSYYNTNKELYKAEEETVRVKHILIKTVDDNYKELANQEELKKKAEDILGRAKSGEDFALLAKQYSEDPGSKDNGGEYTFGRGKMVKEFEDMSFSLMLGEISGLVKTVYGYHIIKLEEKYEKNQVMPFESVKNNVILNLQQKKAEEMYNNIIEDWKKNSEIIKNDEIFNSIR